MAFQEIDPPRLPDTDTSSLGLDWPPNQNGSFNRVRGAWPGMLAASGLMQPSSEILTIATNAVKNGKRCVIKAIAPAGEVNQIIEHTRNLIEAAIPFEWQHSRYFLLYIGNNPPGRDQMASFSIGTINSYLTRRASFESCPGNISDSVQRMIDSGCYPHIAGTRDLKSLSVLYSSFGWNKDEVGQMLTRSQNTILLAEHQYEAVGAVMIERGNWRLNDHGLLRIAELTEGVVRPNWRKNGIIHGLSALATRISLESGDITYAEDNIWTTGHLPQRLGRVGTPSEWKVAGVLKAHVPVNDGSNDKLSCFYPSAIDLRRAHEWGYFSTEMDEMMNYLCLSI